MGTKALMIEPHDYAKAMNVLGVRITVLAASTATGGYEITLQEGPAGAGPPPHRHDWDESFFVLEGEVEIHCDGRSVACRAGTLVHVPRGTVHGFRFAAGGGRMLEVSGPGGRATQMFTNVSREVQPGVTDVPRLLEILSRNGVTVAA